MSLDARSHDGRTLYVARDEAERGSKAPFFVVYVTDDRSRRWGFLCSNCETLDTAVDSMGRIQCNRCANLHKAEEWDAAHE
jgi:late competence protein required for DNA uptake (superfamily II DNA/RNA helicase)